MQILLNPLYLVNISLLLYIIKSPGENANLPIKIREVPWTYEPTGGTHFHMGIEPHKIYIQKKQLQWNTQIRHKHSEHTCENNATSPVADEVAREGNCQICTRKDMLDDQENNHCSLSKTHWNMVNFPTRHGRSLNMSLKTASWKCGQFERRVVAQWLVKLKKSLFVLVKRFRAKLVFMPTIDVHHSRNRKFYLQNRIFCCTTGAFPH